MSKQIRYADIDDLNTVKQLWEISFPEDSRKFIDWFFDNRFRYENALIYSDQGQVLSALHITDYTMVLRGTQQKVAFITGAATFPEARGQGYMPLLLNYAMKEIKARGYLLSGLYPFSHRYYQKFGYETYTELHKRIITDRVDDYTGYTFSDRLCIHEAINFYNTSMQKYNGYIYRNSDLRYREYIADDGKYLAVYQDNTLQAYILYIQSENEIIIEEAVYSDINSYNAIISHLSRLYRLPVNAIFIEPDDAGAPGNMLRIVSFCELINSLDICTDIFDSFIIKIIDDIFGDGLYKIYYNNQNVKCTQVFTDQKIDLSLSINQAAQLVSGYSNSFIDNIISDTYLNNLIKNIFPICKNIIFERY